MAAARPLLRLSPETSEDPSSGRSRGGGSGRQTRTSRKRKRTSHPVVTQEQEEQLNQFLFGELQPFQSSLQALGEDKAGASGDAEDEGEASLPLFMEDRVGDGGPGFGALVDSEGEEDSGGMTDGGDSDAPAWFDPEDARLNVDLAEMKRTRKLRKSQREMDVSGTEYQKRLRRHHQQAEDGESKKEIAAWARLPDSDEEDDGSTGDGPAEGDVSSSLSPGQDEGEGLARLLRSNESLTATSESGLVEGAVLGMDSSGSGVRQERSKGRRNPRQQQQRRRRQGKLRQGFLQIVRQNDGNVADPSRKRLSSVRFHPNGQLLATAGLDKVVRLFHVDGKRNAKVQGVHIPNFPIFSAEFLPPIGGSSSGGGGGGGVMGDDGGGQVGMAAGEELLCSGQRPFFYSYNLVKGAVQQIGRPQGRRERSLQVMRVSPDGRLIAFLGNDGFILLLDAFSKQLVGTMKQNGQVRDIGFTPDSQFMYSVSLNGEVYCWELGERRCVGLWSDYGSVKSSSLACARDGSLATGNNSGVVNVYGDPRSVLEDEDAQLPLRKSVMSLRTPITGLRYNPTSEILCLWSARKKDQLSLVHTASCTVFANWPASKTPLHHVTTVDFSPNSGYFAVGNERGACLLYHLAHYRQS